VSVQAPEPPAPGSSSSSPSSPSSPRSPARSAGKPPGKENVFTRKIGPLPMWVWLAIAAALVLAYVLFFGKKKGKSSSSSSGKGGGGRGRGFGRAFWPPRTHHRHRHGDHHHNHAGDQAAADNQARLAQGMTPASVQGNGTAAGVDRPGAERRSYRGEPVPGTMTKFKASEKGATPSLADVANRYGTSPAAIVEEAQGRGMPHGALWTRYVSQHDWGAPLPPATELSILAHPQLSPWSPKG
jgi:hypothetical protein